MVSGWGEVKSTLHYNKKPLVVHQIMEGKMCSEGAKLSEKNLSRAGVCLVNMTTARRKNPGQPVQC